MNIDELLVRALTNLFGRDTLLYIILAFLFLIIQKRIKLSLIKINISERWSVFSSAWLALISLSITFLAFNIISEAFREKQYGTIPSAKIEISAAKLIGMILISSIIIALGFSIYQCLRKRFISIISTAKKQFLLDGLAVFLLANLSFLFIYVAGIAYEYVLNPSLFKALIILPSILTSIALWLSPTLACAFVFVLFNYIQYNNHLSNQQKELKIAHLQQALMRSQLDALSLKINPHFLYNALNSIAGLANTDGMKARSMAIALAKLFRHNLNKEESNYTTVKDELEMVSTYLEIEKIRFEERLNYTLELSLELEKELIPRHLLQPLVENAVKHGGKTNGVNIQISLSKVNGDIEIRVADDGEPFDIDLSPGYGLKSIYDKLDLLTAGKYEIAFLTMPKAVQIRFKNNFIL